MKEIEVTKSILSFNNNLLLINLISIELNLKNFVLLLSVFMNFISLLKSISIFIVALSISSHPSIWKNFLIIWNSYEI